MTAVFNIVIPILAAGAALAGIYFLIQAFRERSDEGRAAYNVEKQQAHQAMQVDLVRAVFSFVVALILLGVFGLGPRPAESLEEGAPTETAVPAVTPATPTTRPQAETNTPEALDEATAVPSETLPPTPTDLPTAEPPTAVPTATATPEPRTATVNSEVGVWLRAEPNTTSEQLEWLLNGTVLLVLEETATAENLAWQQVQTDLGVVGWVAVPFITYNDGS